MLNKCSRCYCSGPLQGQQARTGILDKSRNLTKQEPVHKRTGIWWSAALSCLKAKECDWVCGLPCATYVMGSLWTLIALDIDVQVFRFLVKIYSFHIWKKKEATWSPSLLKWAPFGATPDCLKTSQTFFTIRDLLAITVKFKYLSYSPQGYFRHQGVCSLITETPKSRFCFKIKPEWETSTCCDWLKQIPFRAEHDTSWAQSTWQKAGSEGLKVPVNWEGLGVGTEEHLLCGGLWWYVSLFRALMVSRQSSHRPLKQHRGLTLPQVPSAVWWHMDPILRIRFCNVQNKTYRNTKEPIKMLRK